MKSKNEKMFRNKGLGFKVKAEKQLTDSGIIWILRQTNKAQIVLKDYDFNRRYEIVTN